MAVDAFARQRFLLFLLSGEIVSKIQGRDLPKLLCRRVAIEEAAFHVRWIN